jgi:hypothetical protein
MNQITSWARALASRSSGLVEDEVPRSGVGARAAAQQLERSSALTNMSRAIAILVLPIVGGLVMGADSSAQTHQFSPGQIWTFRLDPSEPSATLTVLKVEMVEKLGEVVHISVSAVRVPGGVTRIGHLPMSRAALEKSVVALVGTDSAPTDLGGYEQWKRANGGIFTTSVSDAMSFVRQAIERQK